MAKRNEITKMIHIDNILAILLSNNRFFLLITSKHLYDNNSVPDRVPKSENIDINI